MFLSIKLEIGVVMDVARETGKVRITEVLICQVKVCCIQVI